MHDQLRECSSECPVSAQASLLHTCCTAHWPYSVPLLLQFSATARHLAATLDHVLPL